MTGYPGLKALVFELGLFIGLLVFVKGFLPPTRTRLGFSTELTGVSPQFERVIFMVVDAMRSDYLFSSEFYMDGVHELLRDGKGYAFTAFSDPPTVTLPRLKGLTTGASPNFLDAIINIAESDSASTLQNQDSWIHQLVSRNKTLHMFGDDTWLKLFPNTFARTDGTSSFYVADFTEVDNNVTRHLDSELYGPYNDWDALILHYLGLDHIGHKGGPRSPHMADKQREMSDIVRKLYDSLDESTLLVVAGDHGMTEGGNHGGADESETSAALAFFSKKFNNEVEAPLPPTGDYKYYSQVYQVDLVPTLAFLLGFPIPRNSLGVFIKDFLPLWASEEERGFIWQANCNHLDLPDDRCNIDQLRELQRHLMRTSSEYILPYMYLGLAILVSVAILIFFTSASSLDWRHQSLREKFMLSWWLIVPALYFAGMLGSSTVEEEHYIWYWLLSGLLAVAAVFAVKRSVKLATLSLIVQFRLMRGWNTAGQKWVAMYDTADFLASRPWLLWGLIMLSFVVLFNNPRRIQSKKGKFVSALAGFTTFAFKVASSKFPLNLPWVVALARVAMLLGLIEGLLFGGSGAYIFVMQTKLVNIPLWPIFVYGKHALSTLKTELPLPFVVLVGLAFEFSSFFAMGGSNSLATIDLSNAYNGVSGYNIPLVALLTYLGNWSAPLFWSSVLVLPSHRILKTWFYAVAAIGVVIACIVLRQHLFIWTVFSPKLLYVGAWLVFHEILATTMFYLPIPSCTL